MPDAATTAGSGKAEAGGRQKGSRLLEQACDAGEGRFIERLALADFLWRGNLGGSNANKEPAEPGFFPPFPRATACRRGCLCTAFLQCAQGHARGAWEGKMLAAGRVRAMDLPPCALWTLRASEPT